MAGLIHEDMNRPIENPKIIWGRRVTIADWNDAECLNRLRFRKDDLIHLANQLWPRMMPCFGEGANRDRIVLESRNVVSYETLLIIYLFRMAYPSRYRPEMEEIFGMQSSHISRAIECFSKALYKVARQYLKRELSIWHHKMPEYAAKIYEKSGALDCVWGFIDGTFRRICKPKMYQQQCYSGHKKAHGVKFQGVVTPDGFLACIHGPWAGHRHDATMLHRSGLINQLNALMPENEGNGPVYSLYADSAYPLSRYLIVGFRQPQTEQEAIFNAHMSNVRIAVEWGLGLVSRTWKYIDFMPNNRIFLSPYARHYINACFLTNLLNCTDGNLIAKYFGLDPMSVEE